MSRIRSLACCLALLVPAATPGPDGLVFDPPLDTEIQRFHRVVVQLERTGGEWFWNGKSKPFFGLEGVQRLERLVVTTDEVRSVVDGEPRSLGRTFDEVRMTNPYEVKDAGTSGDSFESHLEGRAVSWEWDEESDVLVAELEESDESDPDVSIEGLVEDMDFRGFLPRGDVEPEDTWDVPVDALARALFAGGDLQFWFDSDAPVEPDEVGTVARLVMPVLPTRLGRWGSELSGDVEARLLGARDVDGRSLLAIEVTFDIEGERDVATELTERCEGRNVYDTATVDLALTGEGELLWDPDAGRAHAFTVGASVDLDFEATWSVRVAGTDRNLALDWQQKYEGRLDVESGPGDGH